MMKNLLPCTTLAATLFAATTACAFDLGGLIDKGQMGNISRAIEGNNAKTGNGAGLSGFSNQEQITSLKQALAQGAQSAVKSLAKENGYLGNDKVKIPLPPSLQQADSLLRTVGMGKYADDLVASMNHAAEAAVPEAKNLLLGAVKSMSVDDARSILTGGNDAATQYFRRKTETALSARFKPIVVKSMQKVKLAEKYDQFAQKGAKAGLVDARDANMEDYVTRKAMDGLFVMMAEQEKAIRANPLEATGTLARKVFSAIR